MDDSDAKRALRKKEIEEKRNKLREMRLKKNMGTSLKPARAAAPVAVPDAVKTRAAETSVDELLKSLEPQTVKPAKEDKSQTAEPADAGPAVELTVQKNVVTVDVPPKQVIAYSCEAQTDPIEERSSDSAPPPSPSLRASPKQQHHQIQQQPQPQAPPPPEPQRYLTDVERDSVFANKNFCDFLETRVSSVERALHLNNKYDIMVDYVRELDHDDAQGKMTGKERGAIKFEKDLYSEKLCKHRSVMSVSSNPSHPELVLGAYSEPDSGSVQSAGLCLVWSLQDVLERPEFTFTCQSPLCSASFSPFDPRIIVGSTYCGQIVLWDIRTKSSPVMVSPLSSSGHTHPVYAMNIIGTQNAHNLVTASTDGTMCTWRMDDLRQPIDSTELSHKVEGLGSAIGTLIAVTTVEFYGEETNAFLIGSEEACIYKSYRHGSKKGEFEMFSGHHGPITGVSAHPPNGPRDFSEYFLSSSMDWSVRLWSHKKNICLATFEDYGDYVSDVQWSPAHPGVFSSIDGSGNLALWNLNVDTEIPVAKQKVSSQALTSMTWESGGDRIFVGTSPSDEAGGVIRTYNVADWSHPDAGQWNRFGETLSSLSSNLPEEPPLRLR
mmetsp:Transcript_9732/g.13128  ORF Transcript_9732/g.13128 Transcript_9732/m.13128 type:complete len:606 (-) Transcript_9732:81-1898(-)